MKLLVNYEEFSKKFLKKYYSGKDKPDLKTQASFVFFFRKSFAGIPRKNFVNFDGCQLFLWVVEIVEGKRNTKKINFIY